MESAPGGEVILISTRNDVPHYFETVELDGQTYGLELYWNTRALSWYVSIWDSSFSERLLAGRRLAIDSFILSRFMDPRLPPGELIAVDLLGTGSDPGMKELGQRVVLTYVPAAELV